MSFRLITTEIFTVLLWITQSFLQNHIKHVQALFIFSIITIISRTMHFTCSACYESNSATHVWRPWHFLCCLYRQNTFDTVISGTIIRCSPIPVTARSKAWACGHLLFGNASSKPAGHWCMSFWVLLFVWCRSRRRAGQSSRGVLPIVVCLIVIEELHTEGLLNHEKKSISSIIFIVVTCILITSKFFSPTHCTALNTHPSLKHFYHNTAEHITMYFY
jgi:hypothetical protein